MATDASGCRRKRVIAGLTGTIAGYVALGTENDATTPVETMLAMMKGEVAHDQLPSSAGVFRAG
jgi:hypothetical protein